METWIYILVGPAAFVLGFICGYLRRGYKTWPKVAGSLLIDKTGEKDRWTIYFDEDLGDVENEKAVSLRVDKRE